MVAVGYFNGLIKANINNVFGAFVFDAAVAGLYLAAISRRSSLWGPFWRTPLGRWMVVILLCPTMMAAIPVNHPLIQLVALRAAIWLPLMLAIGYQLSSEDVARVGRWIAVLNLVALGFGIYLFFFGLPSLYPLNEATQFAYWSKDVAGGEWRIPSTFLIAHSYGGTMVMSLPFLAGLGFGPGRPRDRIAAIIGTASALGGLLLCGARLPIVHLIIGLAISLLLLRANLGLIVAVLVAMGLSAFTASQNERFQRIATISDPGLIEGRVRGSVNMNFVDLVARYPLGAGMGSAWGTNTPSFLARYAPRPVGMENEFARILVDTGIMGLAIWIAFLLWYSAQVPSGRKNQRPPPAILLGYGITLSVWITSWIGGGTMAAVPAAGMMFLLQGMVVGTSARSLRVAPDRTGRWPPSQPMPCSGMQRRR